MAGGSLSVGDAVLFMTLMQLSMPQPPPHPTTTTTLHPAQGVADGSLSVGDAVLFVTLMQQLYAPLNFFGT